MAVPLAEMFFVFRSRVENALTSTVPAFTVLPVIMAFALAV